MKRQRMNIQPGEIWVPGLALLFALAYLFQTRDASLTVMRWPYIILAVTTVLWLGIVGRYVLFNREEEEKGSFKLHQLATPALMIVVPVLYLVSMPYLGFALGTFIFLPTLFRLLGSRSWKTNLIIAFLLTLVLQLALVVLMHMNLPRLEIGSFVL